MSLLNNLTIAVGGSHKNYTQSKLEKLITSNGGKYAKAIEPGVTHLVTSKLDVEKQSAKAKSAQSAGIPLVALQWLTESIEGSKLLPEKDYLFDTAVAPAAAASTSGTQTSTVIVPRVGIRSSKRTASNLKDMDVDKDEEEAVKPAPKKAKAAEEEEDAKPAPKRSGRVKKVVVNDDKMDVDEVEEEEKPKAKPAAKEKKAVKDEEKDAKPAAKAKAAPKGKGKGKAKKEPTPEADEEDEEEEEEEQKPAPKMKTVIKKGKAPVDEMFPNGSSWHVYVDASNGTTFDATLNQTDIGNNNNKFYYCQLLELDARKTYAVWVRYGRVGETGQSKMYCLDVSFPAAYAQFAKLFKNKTGKHWEDRVHALGGPGKYAYLERNYEEDDEEEPGPSNDDSGEPKIKVESQLAKPLQSLMQLIFNTDIMQQSMASLSYDSNKLPLGKLSKEVISRGYQTLKDIGEVIEQKPGFLQKYREHGSNRTEILKRLTNRYYTVIPHSFGRNVPPLIDSGPKLKREIELIENLGDMALTTKIMADTKAADNDGVHQLDKQFNSLGLEEAVPLDHSTTEFKHLEAYVKKTQGATHHMNLTVEDIFRVTRSGEDDRWKADGWDKHPKDNRHLLWHGSRSTNFAGILSQGLRIAPPEAPVNGYMFGKGIYLADIVSKSAGYCCAYSSNNTGLLLLCEAQLGDPMFELNQSDYNAAANCKKNGALATKGLGRSVPLKWEDAGIVNESLNGVKMPAVSTKEENITGDDVVAPGTYRSLQYNEYIVYNTSQVKIKYLFKCNFGR